MFRERAIEKLNNYIKATYKHIECKPGKCRMNYRCSFNAVHDAINNGDKYIAMCIYITDDTPIIHFLNIEKKTYIDNTLGHWFSDDIYLVKKIHKDDFFKVNNIFRSFHKKMKDELGILRLFCNIEC